MSSSGCLPVTADPCEAGFAGKEKHIPALFGQTPLTDSSAFWDYFDPNYYMDNMASHIPDENSGRESFSELQLQDWSHPGGDSHSSVRSIDEIVEVQEQFNNTPSYVGMNTDISIGFLSSMEELEHQFIRAAESCSDVSRMLETRKIGHKVLSQMTGKSSSVVSKLLICCKARNITSNELDKHHTKVITWNSSLSPLWSSRNPCMSAQKEDEPPESFDLVEEFCLISGSHASSLDRLYAWERKLYDELKGTKLLEKVYDKKCTTQLTNLFVRNVSNRQVDEARATIKELYSQLTVQTEALYSISKTIEKLRDEELQPQLLELLDGLVRMWRTMQDVHQIQHTIILIADKKIPSASSERNLYMESLMGPLGEMGFFYSSLVSWVNEYKSYVSSLHSWLQKWVVLPLDSSQRQHLTLSHLAHRAPPLFVLLGDWYEGIASLPSQESFASIKNVATDLRSMCEHLAEDGARTKKFSDIEIEANTSQSIGDPDKYETESKIAILRTGLITMFDQLSMFSGAMATLSENVKRETDVALEAYVI